ncbi:MAG: cytochrome ubiquinol oxidase subunit I [Candidatus Zixiibacteriota bacterium]
MDPLFLARTQFAFTIGFHYLFPVLSVGLGLILVFMEGAYLRTDDSRYHDMARFWVRIFGLIFALGVATGIVMEFQFGTNWSTYSRFVGDVFGSALAAEGIFAFFLESGFLAILLFGWNRVSKRMHFFATLMVALGAHFSAIWIVIANSWQQTPAGHHIVGEGLARRAEILDFWQLVFNPSSLERIWHVYMGCWQAGAFLVLSVSAWYLLKKRHRTFALDSIRIALAVAVVASLLQLVSGHSSAQKLATTQPIKLAAMEGHFDSSAVAPVYLFGWVDEASETTTGPHIPGFLSYLVYDDFNRPVTGLKSVPVTERPPVNAVFQTYHAMVAIGFFLIAVSLLGAFLWWRKKIAEVRWFLWILVFSVLAPQAANQFGWGTAEIGRQPYLVTGLLRTSDGLSKSVTAGEIITSLVLFGLIYLLLGVLFVYLLNEKIKHGPTEEPIVVGRRA